MSLIAFSVRRTSLVKPRYLWAALNVTLEKRVRMTGICHAWFSVSSVTSRKNIAPWTICAVALGNFLVKR